MNYPKCLDLHIHTSVSDGTDDPREIAAIAKNAGIELFSVTDHDSAAGSISAMQSLKQGDPAFITGVEFSCRDEEGQFHILGYGYDPSAGSIVKAEEKGHDLRIIKLQKRLRFLKDEYGFTFSGEDLDELSRLYNPGKPHLGNLMVRYGYAATRTEAIYHFLNRCHVGSSYIRPEEAIKAILDADGVPVLAHPSFGRGDELIVGDDMKKRLERLIGFGLQGVEAFYSGFSSELTDELTGFAEKYNLYITAGSDYHGRNKTVMIGQTNHPEPEDYPDGLKRFLEMIYKENKVYKPQTADKNTGGI